MTPDEAYDVAFEALKRATPEDPRLKMAAVARAVEDATGFTFAELRGVRRMPDMVSARQEAWLVCREMGFSLPQIGAFWDRDHSSILHGIRRAKQRREQRKARA